MFRLLYMTFFGDYRGGREHGHGSHGMPRVREHGHGEPHESPMVMLVPLMILALLSLVGGLVGIGQPFRAFSGAGVRRENCGRSREPQHRMVVDGRVFRFWLPRRDGYWPMSFIARVPSLPQKIADSLGGFYQAVLHKYYIDELYAVLFVKPSGGGLDSNPVAGRGQKDYRCCRE